jgi:exosortase
VAATDQYAGHLLLVPVVAALILWRRRDELLAIVGPRNPAGFVLLGGALILLAVAHVNRSYTAHALSVVLAIAGVGLWLRGTRWLRQAAFPLAFLLLMLPPPRSLITVVSPPIQHFVATFSAAAMSFLQIPVERQGFLLRLPNATLHVDEGCNGLRFLLVLFVIITAFAHILVPTPGRRYLLMLTAIPSAVLANAIRVTAIAVTAYLFGPQAASGWIHDYIGRGIWLLTIVALLTTAVLLRKAAAPPRRSQWEETLQAGPV